MNTKSIATALAALTCCFVLTAQAQHVRVSPAVADPTSAWSENIGEQLTRSLASPVVEIKEQALQQIIHFASFQAGQFDLTVAVPALVTIYRTDPDERCRLAAVAALFAIGSEKGMQQVRRGVRRQTSETVQVASLGALLRYYGPRTFERDEEAAAMAEALLERGAQTKDRPAYVAASN